MYIQVIFDNYLEYGIFELNNFLDLELELIVNL